MGRWALDVAFVWKAALTLGLVLLYYCFSIGITFYNKWLTKGTGSMLQPQGPGGAELDGLPQKSGPHSTGNST
uniref:Solute carrier family 35, member C2 n=1 Tax=Mus musculus TaxID=10090 RepID=E0CYZ1_MOUSE